MQIPVLITQRLRLRAPAPRDFDSYAAFRMGPRSAPVGGPFTRDQAFAQFCALFGHWQMHGFGRWMVADLADDTPLGIVGLFFPPSWPGPELAWSLFDGAEGRGIAFEAATAARAHAFDTLGWASAISLVAQTNTRSAALAQRLGAVQDGTQPVDGFGDFCIWRHVAPTTVRETA